MLNNSAGLYRFCFANINNKPNSKRIDFSFNMTEISYIWDNSTLFAKPYSLLQATTKSLNALERYTRYNLLQDIKVMESGSLYKGNSSKASWLLSYEFILFFIAFIAKFYFLRPFIIKSKISKKASHH